LAAGLVLLCASCTGGDPSDDPTGSPSAQTTSASPRQTSPGRSPSSDEQALLDKVRTEGQLSIIVTLKLPQTPAGDAERKKAIADAQDQLLVQLEPLDVEVQTRFELTPQLTLTVDEAALRYLLESPLVDRVHENESIPLEP
jgi:hypothetical protein